MIKKIIEFEKQHQMFQAGDHVICGVSGGADSVCLLLVLLHLQEEIHFSLTAVHVEHGIRGEESRRDERFVKRLCEHWGVALQVYEVDAPERARREHKTLEEAAREIRYLCFEKACMVLNGTKIAVAHHGDDCAETMLFHLARGTGIKGLCGILPVRGRIVRPLLCVTRAEIEAFLQERQQPYCIDRTNDDLEYSRNRIRSAVIPQLKIVNDQAVSHMVRTAEMLEEVCEFVETAAWEAGREITIFSYDAQGVINGIRISKVGFSQLQEVLQKSLLLQLLGKLAGQRKDISATHVTALLELFGRQTGKEVAFPYGMRGVTEYEYVHLCKEETDSIEDIYDPEGEELPCKLSIGHPQQLINGMKITSQVIKFDGKCEKIPDLPCTKWFDYDKINNTVQIRNRQAGDYFVTNKEGNRKKLKDFMINEKILRSKRDQIVLFADGDHVMWICGYRISEAYKVTEETTRILEICVEEGERNE